MSEFTVKESDLARRLGVSRPVVESIRRAELKMYKHWRLEANTVMLTEKGCDLVLKALGVSKKNGAAGVADGVSVDGDGPGLVVMGDGVSESIVGHSGEKMARVVRKFINPRIMQGDLDGTMIRVRVSDSSNFIVGMEISVRPDNNGLYECTRRAPRFPGGRW